MFLRQSIIRGGTATREQVIEGLAAWVTILFDLDNLRHDRSRALDMQLTIPDAAIGRLSEALSKSPDGCILALPHIGCNELFGAHLIDRGFKVGFVYSISNKPTPTELWILEGRRATGGIPIPFGRENTGAEISRLLQSGGVVFMLVDVYPGERARAVRVGVHDTELTYAPGAARYARAGTPVLPAFATSRGAEGCSMNILDLPRIP